MVAKSPAWHGEFKISKVDCVEAPGFAFRTSRNKNATRSKGHRY